MYGLPCFLLFSVLLAIPGAIPATSKSSHATHGADKLYGFHQGHAWSTFDIIIKLDEESSANLSHSSTSVLPGVLKSYPRRRLKVVSSTVSGEYAVISTISLSSPAVIPRDAMQASIIATCYRNKAGLKSCFDAWTSYFLAVSSDEAAKMPTFSVTDIFAVDDYYITVCPATIAAMNACFKAFPTLAPAFPTSTSSSTSVVTAEDPGPTPSSSITATCFRNDAGLDACYNAWTSYFWDVFSNKPVTMPTISMLGNEYAYDYYTTVCPATIGAMGACFRTLPEWTPASSTSTSSSFATETEHAGQMSPSSTRERNTDEIPWVSMVTVTPTGPHVASVVVVTYTPPISHVTITQIRWTTLSPPPRSRSTVTLTTTVAGHTSKIVSTTTVLSH